jgi:hypothetical protein
VRYFIVPAALMLTACALPDVSGMGSFMTAMHPTQASCTSPGLTLDATSKECVTPPASQGAETTGSLPSQTITPEEPSSPPAHPAPPQPSTQQRQAQQSQPQEQPTRLSVPIEQEAVLISDYPQNSETVTEFAHFVRASGYRCDSISALKPRPGGVTLACNQSTFRYAIEAKDGRWIVTIE